MYFQSAILLQEDSGKKLSKTEIKSYFSDIEDLQVINLSEIEKEEKKKSIGIESVKGIYANTRLRADELEVTLIYNAESLTNEAQNALLKTIEEPGRNSKIILISNSIDDLIETVRSRCIIVDKRKQDTRIPKSTIQEFLGKKYSSLKEFTNQIESIDAPLEIIFEECRRELIDSKSSYDRLRDMIELLMLLEHQIKEGVSSKNSILTLYIFLQKTHI